jgi:hypothetical protein
VCPGVCWLAALAFCQEQIILNGNAVEDELENVAQNKVRPSPSLLSRIALNTY